MVAASIMGAAIRPRPVFVKAIEAARIRGMRPLAADAAPQTVRHNHSAICPMTSPNSKSAADHTNADTKLAT
jgi:hypothetical protein